MYSMQLQGTACVFLCAPFATVIFVLITQFEGVVNYFTARGCLESVPVS